MNSPDLKLSHPDAPVIEVDLEPSAHHGYTSNKDAYLKRLKRIEGQVRGIARMVEDDKYCIDILTQVAAATKAQALTLEDLKSQPAPRHQIEPEDQYPVYTVGAPKGAF